MPFSLGEHFDLDVIMQKSSIKETFVPEILRMILVALLFILKWGG
jgi:hypothetical protein